MEDVLEVYAESYDPTRPQVHCDATHKQLIKEPRQPLPAQPGRTPRYADESERHGTRNLLRFVEPQAGGRHGQVTAQRRTLDFASAMPWLVDAGYPEATVIRVVLDNLHTHQSASLYDAFEPAQARRIARKREFPDTPKHGSWRTLAESELRGLQQQCLERRRPDDDMLKSEITPWEHPRNAEQATIDWRLSVTDARKKLERL